MERVAGTKFSRDLLTRGVQKSEIESKQINHHSLACKVRMI